MLTQALEELVNQLPDEDRAAQRALLEKHEVLRGGYLRQADYDRKQDELKALRTQQDADHAKWTQWWNDSGKDAQEHLKTVHQQLNERNAKLEADIATAAAGGNGDGSVNAGALKTLVEGEIQRRGYVAKSDLPGLIDAEAKKMRDAFNVELTTSVLPSAMRWAVDTANVARRFEKEFGTDFPEADFAKFQGENGVTDPKIAYDRYVAGRRQESELAKAREQGKAEALKEVSQNRMPGNTGGPPEAGPGQMSVTGGKPYELPKGSKIGDNTAAMAAASFLRSQGKF